MPAPFNPARRSRNIGTPKQGHGQDNRMTIPRLSGSERWLTASLNPDLIVERSVNGTPVTFIVEKTSGGCMHACTIEDVEYLLSHVPPSDWAAIRTIVFRQPTRKARLLAPVWGRLFYHADLGFRGSARRREGPAIFLEAIDPAGVLKWPTALDPEDAAELERLREDGHRLERTGRRHIAPIDPAAARATQLYRTLPHEIGHWFDWLEKVETPAARGEDFGMLADRYFARPGGEREAFAHRYADALRRTLEEKGAIPFARIEKDHGAGHEGE